jgi:hypothetical protein
MAQRLFIHLNCHSAYSLLEGALPVERLVKLAAAHSMPALGIADTANLFGALELSEKAAKAGIQPIVGCKLPIRFEAEDGEGPRAGPRHTRRGAGGQCGGLTGPARRPVHGSRHARVPRPTEPGAERAPDWKNDDQPGTFRVPWKHVNSAALTRARSWSSWIGSRVRSICCCI